MKKMNLLVVQSTPNGLAHLRNLLETKYVGIDKELAEVRCTNSFDEAIQLAPKEGELIVITSDMFHDSDFPSEHPSHVPDDEKNGSRLAQIIKETINPRARVYVYSEFKPKMDFVDGYIRKNGADTSKIEGLLKMLYQS